MRSFLLCSCNVGFTGWIGGAAVSDQALTAAELRKLLALSAVPIAAPASK